jgi:hypothetical protein
MGQVIKNECTPRTTGMVRILLVIVAGVSLCASCAAPIQAATLFARSFPLTGEVRLENRLTVPVPLVFYMIESTAGALNGSPVRWLSVADHYDAPIAPSPGSGLIDPNGSWIKISSIAKQLAEGALDADGGRLQPQRAISLGKIWNTAFAFDLQFTAAEPNGQPISIITIDGLDGDYDGNGSVDHADYSQWRRAFGTASLLEDGNLNGVVDTADYIVWRNNFGLSLSGLAAAGGASLSLLPAGGAAPEPSSAVLFGAALTVMWVCGKRPQRRIEDRIQ